MRWIDFENPDKEKEQFEKRIKENPNDAQAYYGLGTVHEYARDWTTAKELSDKAISLDPKNITYHAFRSFVNSCLGENEDAIEDLISVVELGGDKSDYYVDRAQDAQCGMDKEYAFLKIIDYRKAGNGRVADQLEKWLLKSL